MHLNLREPQSLVRRDIQLTEEQLAPLLEPPPTPDELFAPTKEVAGYLRLETASGAPLSRCVAEVTSVRAEETGSPPALIKLHADVLENDALKSAAAGRPDALGPVLDAYRSRLEQMLRLRMHPGLRARVDLSDVVQETYVDVAERLPRYLENEGAGDEPRMPLYVWVRLLAAQKLAQLQRRHLGTVAREVGRERAIVQDGGLGAASSLVMADALVASGVSPSVAVAEGEQRALLAEALEELDPEDREILVLRHFESLSGKEAAAVLGISTTAASRRRVRALERLHAVLARLGIDASLALAPKRGGRD